MITLEELLADLNAQQPGNPGERFKSSREWQVEWKQSQRKTREIIATALKNGKMIRSQRMEQAADGKPCWIPVYALEDK